MAQRQLGGDDSSFVLFYRAMVLQSLLQTLSLVSVIFCRVRACCCNLCPPHEGF